MPAVWRGSADAFIVRDGRIAVQTIHYTVDVVTDDHDSEASEDDEHRTDD